MDTRNNKSGRSPSNSRLQQRFNPCKLGAGQPIIKPAPKTFQGLQERQKEIQENRNGMSWYLSFKESSEKCNKQIDQKQILDKNTKNIQSTQTMEKQNKLLQ